MIGPDERAWQEQQRYMLETGQWRVPTASGADTGSSYEPPRTLDDRIVQEKVWAEAAREKERQKKEIEEGYIAELRSVLSDFLSRKPQKFDTWYEHGPNKRTLFGLRPLRRPQPVPHKYHVGRALDSEWTRYGWSSEVVNYDWSLRRTWHVVTSYTGLWKILEWERDTGYYGPRNDVSVKEKRSLWLSEGGQVFGAGMPETPLARLKPEQFDKVFDGAMNRTYASLSYLPKAATDLVRFLR
jgi:hypothetical protein